MSRTTAPFCVSCTKAQGRCTCGNDLLIYPENPGRSFPTIADSQRGQDQVEEMMLGRGKTNIQILGPNSQGVMAIMAREAPPLYANRANAPNFSCPAGYRPSRLAGAESSAEIQLSARVAMVYIDHAHKTLQRYFGKQTAFLVCLGVLEGSPIPQSVERLLGLAASLIGKPQPPQTASDNVSHGLLPDVVTALHYLRSVKQPLSQEFGERLAKEVFVTILETGKIPANPGDIERMFWKGESPQKIGGSAAGQILNTSDSRSELAAQRMPAVSVPRQRESGVAASTAERRHPDLPFQQ